MSNHPDSHPIERSAALTISGNFSQPDRAAIAKLRTDAGTPGAPHENIDTVPLNVRPPAPGLEFDADGNSSSSTPAPTILSKP